MYKVKLNFFEFDLNLIKIEFQRKTNHGARNHQKIVVVKHSGARSPEPGAEAQSRESRERAREKLEARGQRPEDRDRRPEAGGQRPEAGGQRLEARGRMLKAVAGGGRREGTT